MAWPIYSERILVHEEAAGGSRTFTVAGGTRAVIKYAHGVNPEGVPGTFAVYVGGFLVHLVRFQASTPFIHQPMFAVAYATEAITIYMLGTGVVGSVHGFIFQDVSGTTSAPPSAGNEPAGNAMPPSAPVGD